MNARFADQLEKVLALADSNHEGEALGAVRMARQILSRDGMSFGDLAKAASNKGRFGLNIFSSQTLFFEAQIERLEKDVAALEEDLQGQQTQTEYWRRKAFDLEQQLNLSQADAERWKLMARETLEKLWEIGKLTHADEFAPDDAPALEEEQNAA